jgi:hypothetical protein
MLFQLQWEAHMVRQLMIAAVVAMTGSTASAGFSFYQSVSPGPAGFKRVLWSVVNDGVGTGVGVQAISFTVSTFYGTFRITASSDEDGNLTPNLQPGTGTVSATAATTRVHGFIQPLPAGAPVVPSLTPANWGIPAVGSTGPYVSSVSSFSFTGVANPLVQNWTPVIAAFLVPSTFFTSPESPTYAVIVSGVVGGSSGPAVAFSWDSALPSAPYFTSASTSPLVVALGGGTSSVTRIVSAVDPDSLDVVSIALGSVPPELSGKVSLGPAVGSNPTSREVRVNLEASDTGLIGRTFVLPLVASDTNASTADALSSVTIRVVPEPASLLALAGVMVIGLRRLG